MRYRVIDEGGDGKLGRYVVQHSRYGHTWAMDSRHADKLTAVRAMEALAQPPVVIAQITGELQTGEAGSPLRAVGPLSRL